MGRFREESIAMPPVIIADRLLTARAGVLAEEIVSIAVLTAEQNNLAHKRHYREHGLSQITY